MTNNPTKEEVLNYIVKSEVINKSINNILWNAGRKDLIDEFYSLFYLFVCEVPEEKLIRAFSEGWIDRLVGSIIVNQIHSNTSRFYRECVANSSYGIKRTRGRAGEKLTGEDDKDMYGIIHDHKLSRDDSEYEHEEDSNEISSNDPDPIDLLEQSEELADEEYFSLLTAEVAEKIKATVRKLHWKRRTLWELKHLQGMEYREIAEKLNMKYNTVHYSITKTNELIRKKHLKDLI